MRVCIVYDCRYPHTMGSAERWYRNLALRLAEDGHGVGCLTARQWNTGETPDLPGVGVVSVAPRMALYAGGGRWILPPLAFGLAVLRHLLRNGCRSALAEFRCDGECRSLMSSLGALSTAYGGQR